MPYTTPTKKLGGWPFARRAINVPVQQPNATNPSQATPPTHPAALSRSSLHESTLTTPRTARAGRATQGMRRVAEQTLNQSEAPFEGILTPGRSCVRSVEQRAAATREHSLLFADETRSSACDLAHEPVGMREPFEFG